MDLSPQSWCYYQITVGLDTNISYTLSVSAQSTRSSFIYAFLRSTGLPTLSTYTDKLATLLPDAKNTFSQFTIDTAGVFYIGLYSSGCGTDVCDDLGCLEPCPSALTASADRITIMLDQSDNTRTVAELLIIIAPITLGLSVVLGVVWMLHRRARRSVLLPRRGARTIPAMQIVLGRLIGSGHYGRVYEGDWVGSRVALKALDINDPRLLMNEVDVLGTLSHPHVTQLHGVWIQDGQPFIVMEYIPGGTVLNYVQLHRQALPESLLIAAQIASGMRHLQFVLMFQSRKIIHGDLAARNTLVAATFPIHVKIADFGLSSFLPRSRSYHLLQGKEVPAQWSAPEVLLEGKLFRKSDVWSYGVVLWELLSHGQLPYSGWPERSLMRRIRRGRRLSQPELCPDALYELMLACWQIDRKDRPTFTFLSKEIGAQLTLSRQFLNTSASPSESPRPERERLERVERLDRERRPAAPPPADNTTPVLDDGYRVSFRS